MAKKRKLSSLPTIRSKEMKELRETSEDLTEGTVNESGSENLEKVSSAREHLKSVLQDLLVVSDESSEEAADEKEEREAKVKEEEQTKAKECKKEKMLDESRSSKKRRRRIKAKEAQFHHTYVMKLFDRSVDLAQFKEETPLYPICRAWMENQPRNGGVGSLRRRTTSLDLNEEEEDDEGDADSEQGKVKNTYKLPPPTPLPSEPDKRKKLRVPSPVAYERAKEIDMDLEVKPSRDTLLRAHVVRWTAIRKKWHKTGHNNEARFADSAVILKNIFKQAQSSFACTT